MVVDRWLIGSSYVVERGLAVPSSDTAIVPEKDAQRELNKPDVLDRSI